MIEQDIVVQLNQIIYTRKSLSFHLEEVNGLPTYIETFTKLELSPKELFLLCDEVEASNLRHMKPIKFYTEDSELPMIVMV